MREKSMNMSRLHFFFWDHGAVFLALLVYTEELFTWCWGKEHPFIETEKLAY